MSPMVSLSTSDGALACGDVDGALLEVDVLELFTRILTMLNAV